MTAGRNPMPTPNRAHSLAPGPGHLVTALGAGLLLATASTGQEAPPAPPPAPTASLLAGAAPVIMSNVPVGGLRAISLFALDSPEARVFQKHDLVQIIVREISTATAEQDMNTKKTWTMDGGITAMPNFQLEDLVQLILRAGRTDDMPVLDMNFNKNFKGQGDYARSDEFTARLTAEVLDVLPNGNLVLESRTSIKNDQEESVIRVTGICRPADVTPANTILSNQLHDLAVEKVNSGEVKKGTTKGLLTKAFETIFAF